MQDKNNVLKRNYFMLILAIYSCFFLVRCSSDNGSDPQPCTEKTWYRDADGDGLGDPNVSKKACEQPTGYVSNSNDTDDTPCTEQTWYRDADGDGLGDPNNSQKACTQPTGYVANADDNDDTNGTGEDLSAHLNGSDVLMQAFYWDVEPRHGWYDEIRPKLADWASIGVGKIWLAPPSKGQSGGDSMGYDPSDYFDLGDYFQHGTTETRFGSKAELDALITEAHNQGIEVLADIVLNHNSGGALEFNSYRGEDTYTDFDPESGKFFRNAMDFHPNNIHNNDEGDFPGFDKQDLCHEQSNVQDWLWKRSDAVAKYYKNDVGFDGWRFDLVKGYSPQWVKDWVNEVGGFAVGEYWDGNATLLKDWVDASGVSAFDFACFYGMERAFDGGNLTELSNTDMLWKQDASKAVTFVANHDTEKETNQGNRINNGVKRFAYAYIMTHEGYPTIFYNDYEKDLNKDELKNLILIHNSIAEGSTDILFSDANEYIARRNGNPGLILYINFSGSAGNRNVQTNWNNKALFDYSNGQQGVLITKGTGEVTLKAPASGYSIWSLQDF